jgi:hypothetical protein
VLRCAIDLRPGDAWDASFGVERTVGELEDSYGVTLYLQHRF